VLFQPRAGPLELFYKAGPDPRRWWGLHRISRDGGEHWGPAERLPAEIIGPTRNPPVEPADDVILSPSSSEQDGWKLFIERSVDRGAHWQRIGPLPGADDFGAIQPALLVWPGGHVQLLARSAQGTIVESESGDAGLSWSRLKPTTLPNPNSGIAAIMLRDGRALLVYNPSRWRRSPLAVAISEDGEHWRKVLTLETGWSEFSYPSVIQSRDGLVHVVYTWKRERIRHVVIDPARVAAGN
jgi:predicted neuraminidase